MIPSLTVHELHRRLSEKYSGGERRIIGIMIGRYDISLVKDIVFECYRYWHKNAGREFDVFWPGYGEYLFPENEGLDKQVLNFYGNDTRVYFDLNAFIEFKKKLKKECGYYYNDKFELLLVNFYENKLRYNEYIRIDLEKNLDDHYARIREFMEFITDECSSESEVKYIAKKIRRKDLWEKVKGVSISEIVSTAASLL